MIPTCIVNAKLTGTLLLHVAPAIATTATAKVLVSMTGKHLSEGYWVNTSYEKRTLCHDRDGRKALEEGPRYIITFPTSQDNNESLT